MSDLDALVPRARAGDREALEGIVRQLQDPLYRLALRFLGHPETARDATQEVLILVITQLSTFRGDASLSTWAYRIAARHLLRQRRKGKAVSFESLVEEDLSQPPNEIAPQALANAEARLLEEEVFLGCTQAMLRALDKSQRLAFILGAILELESAEAAAVLEISEAAFRKRLSRARSVLDAFVARHCGVANHQAPCRCGYQVNHGIQLGRLDPSHLRFAQPAERTSLEALRAFGEIQRVRRSLELYRAQPELRAPQDFAQQLRKMIDQTALSAS